MQQNQIGQFRKPSDAAKLRLYRPDFKFTPLEEGIELTAKWFIENYPNVRMPHAA